MFLSSAESISRLSAFKAYSSALSAGDSAYDAWICAEEEYSGSMWEYGFSHAITNDVSLPELATQE
jgi:hypothetical protein